MIDITIPIRTLTFNQLLRTHFRKRKQHLNDLAWHIRALAGAPPRTPIQHARVTIHRYTTQQLDDDGKGGVAKGILDVLQPCSKRHPLGMGYIQGDDPKHLELVVLIVKSTAAATRVIIEDRDAVE